MAYAAITSLMSTMEQSLQSNRLMMPLLLEKLYSLRAILEEPWKITSNIEVLTSLEDQITELALKAQDMVDSKSRKSCLAQTAKKRRRALWKLRFLLKQAVQDIDSNMMKWMAIRNRYNNVKDVTVTQNLPLISDHISHPAASAPENMIVGRENEFDIMLDQLARGSSELEVVSIVGMGGIGKTTLATKIYNDPFIMSYFDIRAKTTVSQEYCTRNVFLSLLSSITEMAHTLYDVNEGQLADRLQKTLKGRRYLIIIDDIWTTKAWDDFKQCFPDYNKRSRILLTTRNMEVAEYASSGKPPYQMRLLNFDESWNLMYNKVFVKEHYSPEFEQLGKEIALKCGGLPLAIAVIAGLLSKIGKTLKKWRSIAENVSSLDLDDPCMRVLALSYHHLPHHLKACFLYFAIFPEDELISASRLKKLWVAEGFLKVEEKKSTEEVAEKCLKDLIDRSLIFIHNLSFDGRIKTCGMHDMIRELSLREARNVNFANVIVVDNYGAPLSLKGRGRIVIESPMQPYLLAKCGYNTAHSLFQFHGYNSCGIMPGLGYFKLLRVLDLVSVELSYVPSCTVNLFHLRYLAMSLSLYKHVPPSITNLNYLQTFILKCCSKGPLYFHLETLKLQQLRHLHLDWNYLYQYNEPMERRLVLENLQCILGWNPLHCTGSIIRLFPNLKKLQIYGPKEDFKISSTQKVLNNLCYLDQLETLKFHIIFSDFPLASRTTENCSPLILPPPGAFPQNLKKLAFIKTCLSWKDLSIVGKLPKLEVLELEGACEGEEWEVIEEGFPHLKLLLLKLMDLKNWRATSDQFPCLEQVFIESCRSLDSIPQDFADIMTLELIDIVNCQESLLNSAHQIQQEIGDNVLEVRVRQHVRKWYYLRPNLCGGI